MDPKLETSASVMLVDVKHEVRSNGRHRRSKDLNAGKSEYIRNKNAGNTKRKAANRRLRLRRKKMSNLVLWCATCNYSCNTKRKMVSHQIVHSPNRPFPCPQCSFSSKRKRDLYSHMNTHNNVYQFNCTRCDYKTKYKKSFENHLRQHDNEIILKCPKCEFNTTRKKWLKNHMKEHGREFVLCEFCEYKTPYRKQMKSHMKTHGARLFDCSLCDYKARSESRLHTHVNKNHACSAILPDKMATLETNTFCCDKCNYIGTSHGSWQNHVKTHEKDSVEFGCKFCDYFTFDMSVFVAHVRRFHLEEIESQRDIIVTQEESNESDCIDLDDEEHILDQYYNNGEENLHAYNTDGDIKLTVEESKLNDWKEIIFLNT